jgi:hypothetical protein
VRRRVLMVVVVTGLVAAACGSSDDPWAAWCEAMAKVDRAEDAAPASGAASVLRAAEEMGDAAESMSAEDGGAARTATLRWAGHFDALGQAQSEQTEATVAGEDEARAYFEGRDGELAEDVAAMDAAAEARC